MIFELDLKRMSKKNGELGTRTFPREKAKYFRDTLECL